VIRDNVGKREYFVSQIVNITARKKAEEALKKSEEKFSKAFRESPLAITLTRVRDHRYIEVNETFECLTGYSRGEVLGRTPFEVGFWVNPLQRLELLQQLLAEGSIRDVEVAVRAKDDTIRVGLASAEVIEIDGEQVVLAMTADITERKRAEEALFHASRRVIEAEEQERTRIARELHDNINQRLAHHEFAARQKVEIDFTQDEIPKSVPPEVSLCLFRVLQEALHNAAKHSHVRHFEVRLGCSANQLHLTVSDRGTGFDVERATNKGGLGLTSMRERVRLVNGTIAIDSKPMGGTSVQVRVPLESEENSQRAAV
jgi:PAS domain S-box-containing protein